LGAGLAAACLFPFIEYYSLSSARLGADRQPFVLPIAAAVRFLLPKDPGSHPIEAAATVSLAVLALVPFSFSRVFRDREAFYFTVAGVLCLLVAYENPLSELLAARTLIYWPRALLLLPLALGYLASLGLDHLRARSAGRGLSQPAALVLVGVAGLELIVAARDVHPVTPVADLAAGAPILDRLLRDRGEFHVLPLHTFLPANTATQYGLDDLRGYDALASHPWRRARREIGIFRNVPSMRDVIEPWDLAAGGSGLDRWSVKYLLLHPQFQFSAETLNRRLRLDLTEVYAAPDGRLLLNRRALPRVRWVGSPPALVSVTDHVPAHWTVQVDASSAGKLVVADPNFPGWASRVNDRWSPVDSPYGAAMEVRVPAGRHEVKLAYRPTSFRLGVTTSLASLLFVTTLGLRFRRGPGANLSK
jgi:hypothetical protein